MQVGEEVVGWGSLVNSTVRVLAYVCCVCVSGSLVCSYVHMYVPL